MKSVTYEEIVSQPHVWNKVSEIALTGRERLSRFGNGNLSGAAVFIGCGTSYYLALSAASLYTLITGNPSQAASASDVLFFPDTVFPGDRGHPVSMLISRSGQTTEVVQAAGEVKRRSGEPIYGISCRPHSDLMRVCTSQLVIPDADEQSVVMTRSFTSMLLYLQHLAGAVAGDKKFVKELSVLPEKGADLLDRHATTVRDFVNEGNCDKFIYLGQGPFYGLACEGMLKIKEMSLSPSEAYHSLEFRHGPMSLVDEDMLITFLLSEKARREEITLLEEMKQLGARILVIAENIDSALDRTADFCIELKSGLSDCARMILYMPILQLLGYHTAVKKGLNPDAPKNLTQVVTLT